MRFVKSYLLGFIIVAFIGCSKDDTPAPVVPPPAPPVNSDSTFTNPLLSSGPDPWVIKKDSFYYYMHTLGNRIAIWKTTTLSKLNFTTPVTVWTKPVTGPNSENIWAPELHFLDNKWYIYFTGGSSDVNTSQRIFVLENTSPDPTEGTWTEKGEIRDTANDFWAIDADVFEYNGTRYMVWSGHANNDDYTQRIYIAALQNPWTLATARTEISQPTYDWEIRGSNPLPKVNEGPEVIKNPAGKPLLIFSASGCWTDDYCMGMSLLKDGGNPLSAGDWVKSSNPVFIKSPVNSAFGPGHCAFFKSPDGTEDWLIYHANTFTSQGCGDVRNPRMQKFTWNSDGTPNFGEPVKINTAIRKPAGEK